MNCLKQGILRLILMTVSLSMISIAVTSVQNNEDMIIYDLTSDTVTSALLVTERDLLPLGYIVVLIDTKNYCNPGDSHIRANGNRTFNHLHYSG